MNAPIAKSTHLGERRFLEHPLIAADEWGAPMRAAPALFTPVRLVAGMLSLAALAAVVVLALG